MKDSIGQDGFKFSRHGYSQISFPVQYIRKDSHQLWSTISENTEVIETKLIIGTAYDEMQN
jgi:hypothetical protein